MKEKWNVLADVVGMAMYISWREVVFCAVQSLSFQSSQFNFNRTRARPVETHEELPVEKWLCATHQSYDSVSDESSSIVVVGVRSTGDRSCRRRVSCTDTAQYQLDFWHWTECCLVLSCYGLVVSLKNWVCWILLKCFQRAKCGTVECLSTALSSESASINSV